MDAILQLDVHIPISIREKYEKKFYAEISKKALLDTAVKDPNFLELLTKHIALYSDHGVVHMRDVAQRTVQVLDLINGILIPARSSSRMQFMKGYGIMVAYLHDIGMNDFSLFGRTMHPEFAAQYVYHSDFDDTLKELWDANCANMAQRLSGLKQSGQLEQDPNIVLREAMALSVCHSKTSIPEHIFSNPIALRKAIMHIVSNDLQLLYAEKLLEASRQNLTAAEKASSRSIIEILEAIKNGEQELKRLKEISAASNFQQFYTDFNNKAFGWLISPQPGVRELVEDVVDTIRILRCADALRQRGTTIKTSAGYQIFLSRQTGRAIFALKKGNMQFLLEDDCLIPVGEANIAVSEFTASGDLRISFHQGDFSTPEALSMAVKATAFILNDIQKDVIGSFYRSVEEETKLKKQIKLANEIQILIEGVDENPRFASLVAEELFQITPSTRSSIKIVPSLQYAASLERDLYLGARDLNWDLATRQAILSKIAALGHRADKIDAESAFNSVREIVVYAGQVLIQEGSQSGFCYIPMTSGLMGIPAGGYEAFEVHPWIPLGATSVIRGAPRNATITALSRVLLLMIPKEVYLKYWHFTYSPDEFRQKMKTQNSG